MYWIIHLVLSRAYSLFLLNYPAFSCSVQLINCFCSIVSSRVLTELLVENCSLSRLAILVSMLSTNILHLYLHPYQGILHLMGALHKWEKTNSCWCIHWVVLKFLGQVYNSDHRNRMSILYQSSRKMNLFFCAFFIGTFY